MKLDTAINNVIIVTGDRDYVPFVGSVAISDGKIEYVGNRKFSPDDTRELIDGSGKVLMPGLINGHCHGDMTLVRGIGDDLTLQEQNELYAGHNWFKEFITTGDRYKSRQLTYVEALLNGTTFILENMYWDLDKQSVKAMSQTGIRGGLALDIRQDFTMPEIFLADELLKEFRQDCLDNGLVPVVGSISEEDFHAPLLAKIKRKTDELGLRVTCHLAETDWRKELVSSRHQDTPISYLSRHGTFDGSVIASHVIHATRDEINLLAENEVKVVSTPLCEMKIADGTFRGKEMLDAGVVVGLGTDGALWNNSNDIFREMKGTLLIQTARYGIRAISKKQILDMATINGAKVFGLEERIGTVEVGKLADLILIDLQRPHLCPVNLGKYENITSLLVNQVTGQDVTDVFVNGNHVVRDRQLQTLNTLQLMGEMNDIHQRIVTQL
ncbi:amidohydrolase family protein [Salmonella enterica]|nr:amidohydrolase family protein [Salmonella enterica]